MTPTQRRAAARKQRFGQAHISVATLRDVWTAATAAPHASIRELAAATGRSFSVVRSALLMLDAAGYIQQPRHRCRARRIMMPCLPSRTAMNLHKQCPDCGAPMVIRRNSRDNSSFWGCSRFPDCRATAPLSEAAQLIADGAPTLFDEVHDAKEDGQTRRHNA